MAATKTRKKPSKRGRKVSKPTTYYTRQEAARVLGLTISGVRALEARKALKGVRRGRRWLFSSTDVHQARAGTRIGKREQKAATVGASSTAHPGGSSGSSGSSAPAVRPQLDPIVSAAFSLLEQRKRPLDLILELHLTPERARELWEQYREILALSSSSGLAEPCMRCHAQPACLCLECAAQGASSRGEDPSSSSPSQEGAEAPPAGELEAPGGTSNP